TNGSMGALLQLRDVDLPGVTAQVNQFTNNLFSSTVVSQSSDTLTTSGGSPNLGDTFTAVINGTTYTTAALAANSTMVDLARALNVQLPAATVAVGGGAPGTGDVFSLNINGTTYTTQALAGGGPFTSTDIVNALNTTLTSVNVPVTVNTPATGDSF